MYCKDCKHAEKVKAFSEDVLVCVNTKAVDEDMGQKDTDRMMLYAYNEGGCFMVGPLFGCVHYSP